LSDGRDCTEDTSKGGTAKEAFLGFRPFARRGAIVTNELIDSG